MKELERYYELMNERPYLFENQDASIIIETNKEVLMDYMNHHSKKLGVVYESSYHLMVVDLIKGEHGYYPYERLIHSAIGRGVVCIVKKADRFILLHQYRHALRGYQYAFVRGFGEGQLSGIDNAKKEVEEELQAHVQRITKLGEMISDSGLCGSYVDIYLCEIDHYQNTYEEGIKEVLEVSEEELQSMIQQGLLNDGYSLSAFMFYQNQKGESYAYNEIKR